MKNRHKPKADEGQDLVEYGLLASLVSIAATAAITSLGGAVAAMWQRISELFS